MMDGSTVSGQDNCIFCIPLESLCFGFGIVCCVLSVFGLSILTFAQILCKPDMRSDFYWDEETNTAHFALVIFLYVHCISLFVFSVILSYGAHARRSCYLKAYVVYGAVATVLTLTSATVCFCFSWILDSVDFCIVFVACCIYSLPLLMVQRTYRKFRVEKALYIAKLGHYLGR